MDINKLDIEIINKVKEGYKSTLKRKDVSITFNPIDNNINTLESTTVKKNKHNFILYKNKDEMELMNINNRYYKFFSTKLRIKLKKLTNEQRKKKIRCSIWYTTFLVPFMGKRLKIVKEKIEKYYINYNGIIVDLSKLEYDRFNYYAKYVYKLQQLYKLNSELNIQQEFSIIFDDDKSTFDLYNNFYSVFGDVIENTPLIDNFDDIDDDIDD
jgi:hypothetical protein